MKSVRKRSHQTDSNQILVSIISHKHNGLRNNDTIDDTKKVILYPKVASDSKKKRYMLELLPDKNKRAIQTKELSERFKIFLDPFMILILQLSTAFATIVQRNYEIRKMIIDTPRYHKMVNIFI